MLANAFQDFCDPKIRHRGEELYRRGAVTIEMQTPALVTATVVSTQLYSASLERAGGGLHGQCHCAFFVQEVEICKHIWATLLAADETRLLRHPFPQFLFADFDEDFELEYDEAGEGGGAEAEDYDEGEDDIENYVPATVRTPWIPRSLPRNSTPLRLHEPDLSVWRPALSGLMLSVAQPARGSPDFLLPDARIRYVLDLDDARWNVTIVPECSRPKKNGNGYTKFQVIRDLTAETIERVPDNVDRELLFMVLANSGRSAISVPPSGLFLIAERMCATGRFFHRYYRAADVPAIGPLRWAGAEPFRLSIRCTPGPEEFLIDGEILRGEERIGRDELERVLSVAALAITKDNLLLRLEAPSKEWIDQLLGRGEIRVPKAHGDELVQLLSRFPASIPFDLPDELRWSERASQPVPILQILSKYGYYDDIRHVNFAFEYDEHRINMRHIDGRIPSGPREVIVRDREAEAAFVKRAMTAGVQQRTYQSEAMIPVSAMAQTMLTLAQEGWIVELEGTRQRLWSAIDLEVVSGIDWFDLHGGLRYGEMEIALPELLRAARSRTPLQLPDGSTALIPRETLDLMKMLEGMGERVDGGLRFKRGQAAVLDALLEIRGQTLRSDEAFASARDAIRRFDAVRPEPAPAGFVGTLRDYQCDALGWFTFLRALGFGGCLADDMGLGKTIQILALLESRRDPTLREGRPSIVVAPRSLIFNWREEAARFVPALRILDHSTSGRDREQTDHFEEYDLILTSYGTLKRDAAVLSSVSWDYAILDESQAIKNPSTAAAKAVRLLDARHRLALSGTPIENHLGELWSLFEFLNPGVFAPLRNISATGAGKTPAEVMGVVSRAVRPYILRRTKSQVARELPSRTEQTIHCELEGRQRKLYDELREYYRRAIAGRIEQKGLAKSKIHVLEALLRLRQAACHPQLVRANLHDASSAKLDTLDPRVRQLVDEGHKVLVFSQFTSFLAIVRQRMVAAGIDPLYLDGKTKDRGAIVRRFQDDPDAQVFLISLKAGGLGLNLTAAEYVFLLDPWWNPAVEAQAIDRAHRIGQTRQVFAYRLVARDTIEEKILALQDSKRELADAILGEDKSLISGLTREDLEYLFG